jgi:hypothetical protein
MSSNQPTKRTFFIPNPIVSRIEPTQRLEALNEYAKLINDVLAIEGYNYQGVKQNVETVTTTIDVNPVVPAQSTT